ncbi:hypothetical protein M885DRAFT_588034 [Pelagophyceae sp. CCMP2097]|nr:hypothetical protein M885DRAFT_588034 [Pelagophyceae sp. CCMP2097]|mmetsp:Transcript_25272/g.86685  ORF Transcript_25272/g.86685 Transcript_25272/m.86685 type:complete len:501 (-) Transcript_25272:21-1523(-)
MRGAVALLLCAPAAAVLKELSIKRPDELKKALFGGECYAVACSDVGDKGMGELLLDAVAPKLAPGNVACALATLKCRDTLPSGQTTLQRLGLSAPQAAYPLIFVAVNGYAQAVPQDAWATVDAATAQAKPDSTRLAVYLDKAALPMKPGRIATDDAFQKRCVGFRHCLLLLHNSSAGSDANAVHALADAVASRRRTARVVVADEKAVAFSLANALPTPGAWAKRGTAAPRAVYLRALSKKERDALAAQRRAPPKAPAGDGGVAASACDGARLAAAKDEAAAAALFDGQRVAPRDFAAMRNADKLAPLIFRLEGHYLSYAAAAPLLVGAALYGGAANQKDVEAQALKFPVGGAGFGDAKSAATSFKASQFGLDALDAWLGDVMDLGESAVGDSLRPLKSAPRFIEKQSKPRKKEARQPKAPKAAPAKTKKEAPPAKAAAPESPFERSQREAALRQRMEAEAEAAMPQAVEVEVDAAGGDFGSTWDDDAEEEGEEGDDILEL